MALYQYTQQMSQALSSQNGEKLGSLLIKKAMRKKKTGTPLFNQAQNLEGAIEKLPNIDDFCNGQVQSPFDEIMSSHFKALMAIQKSNYIDAYVHQSNLVTTLNKQFGSESTNWLMGAVRVTAADLRLLGKKADEVLRSRGQKDDRLEDAARILNSIFAVCVRDSLLVPTSRKWGALFVVNSLFKIHFALNTARLCKSLIRTVEQSNFPNVTQFPVAQTVTYKYFVGRLNMYDGHMKKAEEDLSLAFERCTVKNHHNKRSILLFLVPVKILVGKMPTKEFLNKYNLNQFSDIVTAVKTGNLKLFNDTLEKHYQFFTHKGIYLILEKAKMMVYRTLFKKIFLILNKQTKIPLNKVAKVFEMMQIEMDLDEIECVIANLIYKGFIKGYLSHQMRVLVVSATKAFPPLSSVQD